MNANEQITIGRDHELTYAEFNTHELPVVHESWLAGRLWLFCESYGPSLMIVADSFEDAWESMLDNALPIEESEVPEAYGCRDQGELDALCDAGEYPELVEGYEYQPNATGTGIVSVDHNATLQPFTRAMLREPYHYGRFRIVATPFPAC